MLIYTSREILKKKYTIQRISKEQKKMKIMDKKIKNTISNEILIETDKKSLKWCNQYRLVPKSNKNYWLVVDMKRVNQFMKPIHFKMENTPTLKQFLILCDFL
jgi:hypothetical protein